MNFISWEFVLFFPLTLLLYRKFPQKCRWVFLLLASYLAYAYFNTWTVFIMIAMTLLTFAAAGAIARTESGRYKRLLLWAVTVFCIGLFVSFRAVNFLPVGISFYLFQMLSYVFDVYRGQMTAEKQPGFYALYISFFPQLVAGPIERPKRLLAQLHALRNACEKDLWAGWRLILRGFYKKVVVADYLAGFVDRVYGAVQEANGPAAACATMLFAIQIYCDFSGYSDIARGAARMMGIRLMENFNRPYKAESIQDFWHRWHISLTGWFTDYVYRPLGGNRRGLLRHLLHIMIVFVLSGLWHGLAWNYVIWGCIHGAYLSAGVVYRRIRGSSENDNALGGSICGRMVRRSAVFVLVCFAWIFFRAADFADAVILAGSLPFGWSAEGILGAAAFLGMDGYVIVRLSLMLFLLSRLSQGAWEDEGCDGGKERTRVFMDFLLILLIASGWLTLLSSNAGNAFIYFRF